MTKDKFFKTIYWVLFGGAVVFLYFSLRTKTYQLEYALAALTSWGGAFFLNRLVKSKDSSE